MRWKSGWKNALRLRNAQPAEIKASSKFSSTKVVEVKCGRTLHHISNGDKCRDANKKCIFRCCKIEDLQQLETSFKTLGFQFSNIDLFCEVDFPKFPLDKILLYEKFPGGRQTHDRKKPDLGFIECFCLF